MTDKIESDQIKEVGLKFLLAKMGLTHPATASIAAIILTVLGGIAQQDNIQTQKQQSDQSESIAYLLLDIMQENQALKARIMKLEQEKQSEH